MKNKPIMFVLLVAILAFVSCIEVLPNCEKKEMINLIKVNKKYSKQLNEKTILYLKDYIVRQEIGKRYSVSNIKNEEVKSMFKSIKASGFEVNKINNSKNQFSIYLNPSSSCVECMILYSDFFENIEEINSYSVMHKNKLFDNMFFICDGK